MIASKKQEFDTLLESVITKIDSKTVTCDDFNMLIAKTMIGESTPESIRDRVRRRTTRNSTDSHIDNETGHQKLAPPTFAARVQPKRKPGNQQSHGRAGIAHNHSARTQARTMAASLKEAKVPERFQSSLSFIVEHLGKPISDETIRTITNKNDLRVFATKLMNTPNADRDWLYDLIQKLG